MLTSELRSDFELAPREPVRLSDFRGKKHVVLAFHPLAFTPVCAVQMQTYERERPQLDALDAHVLAHQRRRGAVEEGVGRLARRHLVRPAERLPPARRGRADYGVMRDDGISERAIFVVDKDGKIAWAKQYEIPEQPDTRS